MVTCKDVRDGMRELLGGLAAAGNACAGNIDANLKKRFELAQREGRLLPGAVYEPLF